MDLDKSFSTAEAFVEVEQAGPPNDQESNCLNCGAVLSGPYCSQCGQKRIPRRQTLGELLTNFVSSFISFESKFLKTGKYLLFHPGRLPIDYNAGKRERHYHPARLYVFISFVFFLLYSLIPDQDSKKIVNYSDESASSFKMEDFDKEVGKYKTPEQYDSAQLALPAAERDGFWKSKIRKKEIELDRRFKGRGHDFSQAFTESFTSNVPKMLFLLLPVFALILKALYIRRDFYYSEHLVFSIHYYNFFFLAGSLMMVLELIPYVKFLNVVIFLWIGIYLLLAMKRVYQQPWWKTLLKFGTFNLIFCFFIITALVVNLVVSLILV